MYVLGGENLICIGEVTEQLSYAHHSANEIKVFSQCLLLLRVREDELVILLSALFINANLRNITQQAISVLGKRILIAFEFND